MIFSVTGIQSLMGAETTNLNNMTIIKEMKRKPFYIVKILFIVTLAGLLSFCQNRGTDSNKGDTGTGVIPELTVIREAYITPHDSSANVDSPAIWHGPDGQNWVLVTAKEGNTIIVYDASTGDEINRFGRFGPGIGEFSRPNGIAVIDNIAMVAERDNHRIQTFSLPEFEYAGHFGEEILRRPYGITVDKTGGSYSVFITDNYETDEGDIPATEHLDSRVHHFRVTYNPDGFPEAEHIKAFGDTSGEGILFKVESLLIDTSYDRLLVADEHEDERNIKIYSLDGTFTGQIIDNRYFNYEPEGIALFGCEADRSGYYIITDQDRTNNTFQIFDRKTLDHIGSFSGDITRNTDGVAFTQNPFGGFLHGAFYAIHDDVALAAFSWDEIAEALGLTRSCND